MDVLTSVISSIQAKVKEYQDQLAMMTLYELLQNDVLINHTYTMCGVKDEGATPSEESKES